MPRSSRDRALGFQAPGIVRILTASDPDAVLAALLFLGIDPTSQEAFDLLVESVVEVWAAPVLGVIKLFDDAVAAVNALVSVATGPVPDRSIEGLGKHNAKVNRAAKIASGKVLTTKAEIERLRSDFQRRMNEAVATFPQFVWPATPGVFEEA